MSDVRGLDRKYAVPEIIGDPSDLLIICGLAGASKDIAHLTDDGDNIFTMAGAMGGATAMGLGLALSRPDKRVLVVTGDGELLMNVGTLATVGILKPSNLSVLCVDNGHYGETGYQESHTRRGVNLELIAQGSAIPITRTVEQKRDLDDAKPLVRTTNGPSFILLKVSTEQPPSVKRSMDATERKVAFRQALLGTR
ncbi:MAG: thiamine pyrophosphate-binding protein [Rhodospirillaceae bacterium]|nr:thiamine pyrophosphate-binding protein [Rhodospirillaceae bacterium]|tara:strand:+ start:347 stop:934 length:588 start_codon:yes stop_codon:yes gene_type:complete